MVLADFRSNAEIGTQESGADFSDEFFHGIPGIAVALASEVSIPSESGDAWHDNIHDRGSRNRIHRR